MYRLILPAMLACALLPGTAAAETNDCTPVTSLPATLTSQGIYCLTGDLATSITSGAAIELANNNVTLDCNGYKIGGLGGGPATFATGVLAMNRSNVTVRNCNVRGFLRGIVLDMQADLGKTASGNVAEDNRVNGNTAVGINVGTEASVIRRNLVTDTGGHPYQFVSRGIQASFGTDVIDNTVDGVSEPADFATSSYGYYIYYNIDAAIVGNRARNIQSSTTSYGFASLGGTDVVFRDNFASTPIDAPDSTAFHCGSGTTRALITDNASIGFATAYLDVCTDGGGNTELPPEA